MEGWYDFVSPAGPTLCAGGMGPAANWFGTPAPVTGAKIAALRFDGSSYLDMEYSAAFNYATQNFSVSLWLRTTNSGVVIDKRCQGAANGCGATPQGWAISVSPQGHLQLLLGSYSPYFYEGFAALNLQKLPDGDWHWVGVSVDREAGRVTLAVDADLQTISIEGYSGSLASPRPLRIGGDLVGGGRFNGELGDLRLYGRALTEDELVPTGPSSLDGQCQAAVCSALSSRSSMVAWYGFDESAGFLWSDRALENNYLSGVATRVEGRTQAGVRFGQVQAGGGLRTADGAAELDFGTSNFSLAAWIRYSPGEGGVRAILDKTGANGGGYSLVLDQGYLKLSILSSSNLAGSWLANRTRLDDGQWHHVAAVVDRGADAAVLYVDGEPETLARGAGPMRNFDLNSRSPLYVGALAQAPSPTQGLIDELALFKSSLSAADIQSIAGAGATSYCRRNDQGCVAPPSGLVSWYRFENPAGAFDDAGAAPNEVLLSSGSFVRTAGRFGGGVRFIAAGQGLRTFGTTPKANFLGDSVSMSFWISPTATGSRVVLEKMTYAVTRPQQGYRIRLVNGRLEFTLAANGIVGSVTTNESLPIDQWSLAVIVLPRDGEAVISINGIAVGLTSTGVLPIGNSASNAPLLLGYSAEASLNTGNAAFSFDELSIYSRALTPVEIQALSLAGQCFGSLAAAARPVFEVRTNPEGLGATVGVAGDGTAVNSFVTAVTPAAVSTAPESMRSGDQGIEYRFRNWSLNGSVNALWTNLVQPVVPGNESATYTANYDIHYRLSVSVRGNCRVTPTSGFHLAGRVLDLSISVLPGGTLNSATWTVGTVRRAVADGASLTLSGPATLEVDCQRASIPMFVSTFPQNLGLWANADGDDFINSTSFPWIAGSPLVLTVPRTTQVLKSVQYTFANWRNATTDTVVSNDSGTLVSPAVTTQYVAEFARTGFQVTLRPVPGCDLSIQPPSSSGFYPPGSRIAITNSPNPGFMAGNLVLTYLQNGSVIPAASRAEVTVDGPLSVGAACGPLTPVIDFTAAPSTLRPLLSITYLPASIGSPSTASGQGTVSMAAGPGTLTLVAPPTVSDGLAILRLVSLGPGFISSGMTFPAPSVSTSYTANYEPHCYLPLFQAGEGGTYSLALISGARPFPNSECFTAGSVVAVTPRPSPGYQFRSWSLDYNGSEVPLRITIPASVTRPLSLGMQFVRTN
ncbi:MAG: LamG domain-containing protein [Bryobacteraceae bacterium]|nr:LamG domain-containing protein [Bryobacteraceae bacterium]